MEAGRSLGWERRVGASGDVLFIDRFGASAPGDLVMRELGMSVDRAVTRALQPLGRTS